MALAGGAWRTCRGRFSACRLAGRFGGSWAGVSGISGARHSAGRSSVRSPARVGRRPRRFGSRKASTPLAEGLRDRVEAESVGVHVELEPLQEVLEGVLGRLGHVGPVGRHLARGDPLLESQAIETGPEPGGKSHRTLHLASWWAMIGAGSTRGNVRAACAGGRSRTTCYCILTWP